MTVEVKAAGGVFDKFQTLKGFRQGDALSCKYRKLTNLMNRLLQSCDCHRFSTIFTIPGLLLKLQVKTSDQLSSLLHDILGGLTGRVTMSYQPCDPEYTVSKTKSKG
uniref:Uncharacterized protein n=1 Tax=Megaselia scalaris TaxID=36166 RepID=T1GNX8_MEGSC